MEKHGVSTTWADFESTVKSGSLQALIVAAPENLAVYPDYNEKLQSFSKINNLVWLAAGKVGEVSAKGNFWAIPMKSFVEKAGTFIIFSGVEQKFNKVTMVVSEALTLSEAAALVAGRDISVSPATEVMVEANRPMDRVTLEHRKKNEFVFKRGSL